MKISPRKYQQEAIDSFFKNNFKGIFEMATGTGKTYTSLLCAKKYQDISSNIFLVICVPFKHLIEQWEESCREIGFKKIIKCSSSYNWISELSHQINNYKFRYISEIVVITTYHTLVSSKFITLINRVKSSKFLIADECHNMGSKKFNTKSIGDFECKLGLSATPDRWLDEIGTKKIYNFFGGVIYEYKLEDAIKNDFLVEYLYKPVVVDFNDSEYYKYSNLTKKIVIEYDRDPIDEEEIKKLILLRKNIINNSSNKIDIFLEKMKQKSISEQKNILVYCSPQNISYITKELGNIGYRVSKFIYKLNSKERKLTLKSFENGEIQIITSIKCLDEGVDVPSIQEAHFLSSTTNPKEFIQRRGRILRKSKDKIFAKIYDYIILPENEYYNIFENVAKTEMPRFAEFSRYAINKEEAWSKVSPYLTKHSLIHLMDLTPWEIYYSGGDRYENK